MNNIINSEDEIQKLKTTLQWYEKEMKIKNIKILDLRHMYLELLNEYLDEKAYNKYEKEKST